MKLFQSMLPGLNPLATALLQASVAAGLLALLVMAARWLGRGSIPVRWLYGLGLLAMARLALPIVPESSFGFRWPSAFQANPDLPGVPSKPAGPEADPSLPQPPRTTLNLSGTTPEETSGPWTSPQEAFVSSIATAIASSPIEEAASPIASMEKLPPSSGQSSAQPATLDFPAPPPAAARSAVSFPAKASPGSPLSPVKQPAVHSVVMNTAGWLWSGGTILILLRAWGQNLRFQYRVRNQSRPAEARIQELAREIANQSGLRRPIAVLEIPLLPGPVSCGWLRPLILLPVGISSDLGDAEVRHILAHETAHLRHRDSLLNWALLVLCALHWFNPLAWLCRRALLIDREILRDEEACQALQDTTGRADYGHTLLKINLFHHASSPSPGLSAFFTTEKEIHRRIAMITRPIATPHVLKKSAASLAAALAVLCTYTSVPAQKPGPEESLPSADLAPKTRNVPEGSTPRLPTKDGQLGEDADAKADAAPAQPPPKVPAAGELQEPLPVPPGATAPRFGIGEKVPEMPGASVNPTDEIRRLRQEVTTLQAEMSAIRKLLQQQKNDTQTGSNNAPVSGDADRFLESELLKLRVQKRKAETGGLGAKHPKIREQEDLIQSIEKRLSESRNLHKKAAASRDDLIRKLITLKGDAAKMTSEIDSMAIQDKGQFATKEDLAEAKLVYRMRAAKSQELGKLKAEIVEIETRLQYNVLD